MKRKDLILLASVIVAALLLLALQFVFKKAGTQVQVMQDGKVTAVYPLAADDTIVITGEGGYENVLAIADGTARMTKANCPDKLCVRQKSVRSAGESIICLSHKLAIEIIGGEPAEIDTFSR